MEVVNHHGGRVLAKPNVYLIFWGSFWRGLGGLDLLAGVIQKAHQVVEGSFIASLDQYGVRDASFGDWVDTLAPDVANKTFSDDNISQLVSRLVDAGVLPPNDANNGQNIYCVILPPDWIHDTDPGIVKGGHEPSDAAVPAFVVAQGIDGFTFLFSHELAEAATNPGGDGWFEDDADPEGAGPEVADVCEFGGEPLNVNGLALALYRSNWDRACITPGEPDPPNRAGITGTPCAITSNHGGWDEVFAVVRGENEHLHLCYFNAHPRITSWQWQDLSNDEGGLMRFTAVAGSPGAIANVQNPNSERALSTFVQGDDGHLHERTWNGWRWLDWTDRDQPVWNVRATAAPAAATYRVPGGLDDLLQVFVWGDDENLYRYRVAQGNVGRFALGPLPNGARVVSEPCALTGPPLALFSGVYAFVGGSDGNLYVTHAADANENRWQWHDLGQPRPNANPPVTILGGGLRPAALWYKNRAQAFVSGSDCQLWVNSWSPQAAPEWTPLGLPAGAQFIDSAATAVTFEFRKAPCCFAFARSNEAHLCQCRWDVQAPAQWSDWGRPITGADSVPASSIGGDVEISSAPSAVIYTWPDVQKMFVFVTGADGHLHVCFGNGEIMKWTDLGRPPVL